MLVERLLATLSFTKQTLNAFFPCVIAHWSAIISDNINEYFPLRDLDKQKQKRITKQKVPGKNCTRNSQQFLRACAHFKYGLAINIDRQWNKTVSYIYLHIQFMQKQSNNHAVSLSTAEP